MAVWEGRAYAGLMQSRPARAPRRLWDDPRIVFPDGATWERLSPAEREEVLDRIFAVMGEYREAMSEGTRHYKNKSSIGANLDSHFRKTGRDVLIACELAVFYPSEPMIVPDIVAVLDCDPDMDVNSWIVADQKRGIDLVMEVRNLGRKHKDLVENVHDYARLGIPEYFSFDCLRGPLRGWRLSHPGAKVYQPIIPQRGYLSSQILGLDLAVVGGRLRFFANDSMVPDTAEVLARIQTIADEVTKERDEVTKERDEAAQMLSRLKAIVARNIIETCRMRGLPVDDKHHARIVSESDMDTLERWAMRVFTASSSNEIFE